MCSHGAAQVREVVQEAGLKPFPDPFVEGFKYDEEGRIVYPGMQVQVRLLDCFFAQATLWHHSAAGECPYALVLFRTNPVWSPLVSSYVGIALMIYQAWRPLHGAGCAYACLKLILVSGSRV